MSNVSEYIWFLKFKITVREKELEAFRNGNAYKSIRKDYESICKKLNKKISKLEKALADAHSETVTVRKNWSEIFDDIDKEHDAETASFKRQLEESEGRALKAEQKANELKDKLAKERKEKYELGDQLEKANGKIKKLTAQVNKDFSNSSIPSSQQGAARKKIPNTREKTDRKRGGQPGHDGRRLTQMKPTRTYRIPDPEKYSENPDYYRTGNVIKRQKIVLSINVEVIEYSASVFRNRKTGSRVHADFPDGYNTDVGYGESVKSFVFMLANDGNMSAGKIKNILKEATDGKLNVTEGWINRLGKEFSKKSQKEREDIANDIMASPVANIDFTNANVNGDSKQVLIMASPIRNAYMFIARDHKGHKGIMGTPAENYVGTLVHDHDPTFYNYGSAHQDCAQHISRYLVGSKENEPERKWNKQMHGLFKEMLHYKNSLCGATPDKKVATDFEKRYDEILALAKKEYEDEPPSQYYREGYNLYRRLAEYKESVLGFLHESNVPSNNSLAERLARIYKRKQKQAIVFRSDDNFAALCDNLSVINTYRYKEEVSLYDKIKEIFSRTKS